MIVQKKDGAFLYATQRLPREVEALNLDRTDALFTTLEDLRRAARAA